MTESPATMSNPALQGATSTPEPVPAADRGKPTPKPRTRPGPQSGVTNRPPEHLLLAALNLIGPAPRQTVESIRSIVQAELTSALAQADDADPSKTETGELGFEAHHDRAHLTVAVGFSSGAYGKLGVAAVDLPADLVPIPWQQLGDTPDVADSGDLVLQICADNAYITEHVLRRVEHELAAEIQVVWAHTGAQRYSSRPGRTAKREGRAWIGFLDGTSNLQPSKDPADYALTFVNPDDTASYPPLPAPGEPSPYGGATDLPVFPPDLRPFTGTEPAWTRDGTYLAARVSVTELAAWDSRSVAEQEATIGRHKQSGVSLDLDPATGATAETPPAFANDQTLTQVAVDAHIRRSNPRGGPTDLARRMFRRGYPLYEGGQPGLRRGLIFLGYARTLSTQFEFVTRGWLTNPNFPHPGAGVDRLRQFDTHVTAGGYYFVPPLDDIRHPWTWHVPPAQN